MRRPTTAVDPARLTELIRAFRRKRILVLADLVADEFLYGSVQRVSREAPVLILEYDGTDVRLGGGANAVHNIAALGGDPVPMGVLGRDDHGRRLRALLRDRRISTRWLLTDPAYATPVKTRILAGGVHSTKQQMVRIDKSTRVPAGSSAHPALLQALRGYEGPLDGVLVSDYGFGLLTPALVEAGIDLASSRGVPVTVDSRYALLHFKGMTAVTPNEPEVEQALGISIGHDRKKLEAAGASLLRRLAVRSVLITRGSHGMALFEKGRPPRHIPIHGSDQVADVTGAGDTVIATFTLALAAGASPLEASLLANYAGGVVVMKRGTATLSAVELTRAVEADPAPGAPLGGA
jgi:D-glycero-beta-D-manno-heptose-7-phosphate kinase